MARVFKSLDEFKAIAGEEIGASDWHTIDQAQINAFADATGDQQWIHVDVEAAKNGPFGAPIAHGYLTLSLLPVLAEQIYDIQGLAFGMNYGANKLRFPTPVPVDSRVRGVATLKETNEIAIGTQAIINFVMEIEGVDKPALVAEVVYVMAAAA